MKHSQLKDIFNKYYKTNDDLELVIQKLKDAGASQMGCTRTMVLELKIPLSQADMFVLHSKAWIEHLDTLNDFSSRFIDEIDSLNET